MGEWENGKIECDLYIGKYSYMSANFPGNSHGALRKHLLVCLQAHFNHDICNLLSNALMGDRFGGWGRGESKRMWRNVNNW